jgi:hypothetical protein
MKIKEEILDGEKPGDIITKKTWDVEPTLDRARMSRDRGAKFGESYHVADIPTFMIYEWLKEAGVSPTDHEAAQEVVKRKILSGEFNGFRVWEGNY